MKKLFAALLLTASLSACAGIPDFQRSILQGGLSVTQPIQNPVTPAMLYDIENGARAAGAGLIAYRRLCIQKKVDRSCRGVIEGIQPYTRALCSASASGRCTAGLIADLRRFVRQNDQVNAVEAFNAARRLLGQINDMRLAAGA